MRSSRGARPLVGAVLVMLLLAVGSSSAAAMAARGDRPTGWPRPISGSVEQMAYRSLLEPSLATGVLGAAGRSAPNGSGGGLIGPRVLLGGEWPAWQAQQQYPGQVWPMTAVTSAIPAIEVAIRNFAFQPADIQVKVGTTVTWTNEDSVPHTVTFRNGTTDSGQLRPGKWFSYTFTTPGTYEYYCRLYVNMFGRVTVTP